MKSLRTIGKVVSPLRQLEDCPRQEHEQAPAAVIEVAAAYSAAAKDLRTGDAIIVLTWLHQGDRTVQETHPRNDETIPLTGVFSTRSPDRPNPIGLHHATITSISPGLHGALQFSVSQLEVLDGTPVIDIKPDLAAAP